VKGGILLPFRFILETRGMEFSRYFKPGFLQKHQKLYDPGKIQDKKGSGNRQPFPIKDPRRF